jgi:hypothetical protein
MTIIDGDSDPSYAFRSAEDSDDETDRSIDIEDIDLQALAEEVYALLKQELWSERERWGWHQIW